AVEDEHQRHDDDDFVDAGGGARRLADHFAGALEEAARFDDEETDGEYDVAGAHEPSVPILGELRHRRPADAPEDRRHDPVERCDEEVLPLIPDGRRADAVDRAGERDRHFRVGADAEALTDHHPRAELSIAEKVLAAAADPVADDKADGGDGDEIADEHRPVEQRDFQFLISQIRRTHAAASQSAVSSPGGGVPREGARIGGASRTLSSSGSPVNLTVLLMARSIVRLEPARYGVPGSDTRPSSSRSPATPAML